MNPLWIDGRWHLEGRGIHAGSFLELRWPDGTWELVRIESGDQGRVLYAYTSHHEQEIAVRVDDTVHQLRWPERR